MKLYLISWKDDSKREKYSTYDAAVVAAENEDDAQTIHPHGDTYPWKWNDDWCKLEDVKVEYIGEAKEGTKRGAICASFNEG